MLISFTPWTETKECHDSKPHRKHYETLHRTARAFFNLAEVLLIKQGSFRKSTP